MFCCKNANKDKERTKRMFAKAWLIKTLASPDIQNPCQAKAVIQAAKALGIGKNELKTARKELGIQSFNIRGVQYWHLPNGENDA